MLRRRFITRRSTWHRHCCLAHRRLRLSLFLNRHGFSMRRHRRLSGEIRKSKRFRQSWKSSEELLKSRSSQVGWKSIACKFFRNFIDHSSIITGFSDTQGIHKHEGVELVLGQGGAFSNLSHRHKLVIKLSPIWRWCRSGHRCLLWRDKTILQTAGRWYCIVPLGHVSMLFFIIITTMNCKVHGSGFGLLRLPRTLVTLVG